MRQGLAFSVLQEQFLARPRPAGRAVVVGSGDRLDRPVGSFGGFYSCAGRAGPGGQGRPGPPRGPCPDLACVAPSQDRTALCGPGRDQPRPPLPGDPASIGGGAHGAADAGRPDALSRHGNQQGLHRCSQGKSGDLVRLKGLRPTPHQPQTPRLPSLRRHPQERTHRLQPPLDRGN